MSDSKAIEEAAERLRRFANGESYSSVWSDDDYTSEDCHRDRCLIIKAYLANQDAAAVRERVHVSDLQTAATAFKAAQDAATEGPWKVQRFGNENPDSYEWYCVFPNGEDTSVGTEANAELHAIARDTNLPALALESEAENERLKAFADEALRSKSDSAGSVIDLQCENERLRAALESKTCQKCHADGYWYHATGVAAKAAADMREEIERLREALRACCGLDKQETTAQDTD